ncbi:MAG: hypothetical protein MAG431_02475 [Chloroflexi bacterium]|nr:hypothetical protein [Chloroflexota bacterium]
MENEKKLITKYFLILVFLAILIFWMMAFREQITNLRRLSSDREQAQETLSALEATQETLATQVALAESGGFAEEDAREKLKWIQEGDQRIGIIPGEGTPIIPTPTPRATAEPVSNFQVWWELFVGTTP